MAITVEASEVSNTQKFIMQRCVECNPGGEPGGAALSSSAPMPAASSSEPSMGDANLYSDLDSKRGSTPTLSTSTTQDTGVEAYTGNTQVD